MRSTRGRLGALLLLGAVAVAVAVFSAFSESTNADAGPRGDTSTTADVGLTVQILSGASPRPGGTFAVRLTATNAGPSPATNVVVKATLPATLRPQTEGAGCFPAGRTLTCPGPEPLAAGDEQSHTVTVRLDPAYSGDGSDVWYAATVRADPADPDRSDNTVEADLPGGTVEASADLTTTAKAVRWGTRRPGGPVPGEVFTYLVGVSNAGPSTASNARVTATLPEHVSLVRSRPAGCAAVGRTVTCPAADALRVGGAPGANLRARLVVRLDPAYAGESADFTFRASAVSEATDPDRGGDDAIVPGLPGGVPAEPAADLGVSGAGKAHLPVTPGRTLPYALRVSNAGPSVARGVVVRELPSPELSVVEAAGCVVLGGGLECPAGSMDAGESRTFPVVAALSPAYVGDGIDVRGTASVRSETADPERSDNAATVSALRPHGVTRPRAEIATTLTPSGPPVAPGETFAYDLRVTNAGPSTANVTPKVVLPAALSLESSDPAGCDENGSTVSCPTLSLEPGQRRTVYRLAVRLDQAYTGDGSDITSVASVSADVDDSNRADNTTSAGLPENRVGRPVADLATSARLVSKGAVAVGETYDYVLSVSNRGPSSARKVRLTAQLSDYLVFESSQPSGCVPSASTVRCPTVDVLRPGASRAYRFTVKLDTSYPGSGDIRLSTSASAVADDPEPANDEASAAGLPGGRLAKPTADLVLSLDSAAKALVPGRVFAYDLTVTNSGPSGARDVVVSDRLPKGVQLVSAKPDLCTVSGRRVRCAPIDALGVGEAASYTLKVRLAPDYSADGRDIVNVAHVTSDMADPATGNNTSGREFPGSVVKPPLADIRVDTVRPSDPVAPGEVFGVKVRVRNTGPSVATNIDVEGTLPAVLSLATPKGTSCTAGARTVACPRIDSLDVGESKTYGLTMRLDRAYPGDGSDVVEMVGATAQTADPDESDNTSAATSSETIVGHPRANLGVTAGIPEPRPIAPGQAFGFEVEVTNQGPSDTREVAVTAELDDDLAFVASADECTARSGTVRCPEVRGLRVGERATRVMTVRLDPGYAGDGRDVGARVSARSPAADPDADDDAAVVGLPGGEVLEPATDLRVKATGLRAPVVPGGTGTLALSVGNAGPSDTASGPRLLVRLPAGAVAGSPLPRGCAALGASVACAPDRTLAAGDEMTLALPVAVDAGLPEDAALDKGTATVVVPGDTDRSDNAASFGVEVGSPVADLTVDAAAVGGAVPPGDTLAYDITVSNTGPSAARDVDVLARLPAALDLESSDAGCGAQQRLVRCPTVSLLRPGTALTYRLVVRLDATYSGDGSDVRATAHATSEASDPEPANDAATVGLPAGRIAPPRAELAVAKAVVEQEPVAPGETFHYDLTVANHGPSFASDATVRDLLPPMLAFVSSPDGCTATVRRVSCPAAGPLRPGANRTYRVEVRLDPAYTGDGTDIVDYTSAEPGGEPAVPGGTVDPPASDLSMDAADPANPVVPGADGIVRVTLSNGGPSTTRRPIPLRVELPTWTSVGADLPSGCTGSGADVTCVRSRQLRPGGSAALDIPVRVDPDLPRAATLGGGTAYLGGDTRPVTVRAAAPSARLVTTLGVLEPGPVAPGHTLRYEVTVANRGPSTATDPTVKVTLPAALSLVSSRPTAGCRVHSVPVTCPVGDVLAPGEARTYLFALRLDPAYTGDGSDLGTVLEATSDQTRPDQARPAQRPEVTPEIEVADHGNIDGGTP